METVSEVIRRNVPPSRLDASLQAARLGFASVSLFREAKPRTGKGKSAASG